MKLMYGLIASAFLLLGCTSIDPMPQNPLSQRVTVTVSSGSDLPVTSATPLSWYSDVITVSDVELQHRDEDKVSALKALLKSSVQDNLTAKGFSFADEGAASRYQLVVVAMLGDKANAENVQQLFQLYPSLSGDSSRYPKGTVLVGILDQETSQAVWRGATQAFTSAKLTDEERQQRLAHSVGGLLKSVKPGS